MMTVLKKRVFSHAMFKETNFKILKWLVNKVNILKVPFWIYLMYGILTTVSNAYYLQKFSDAILSLTTAIRIFCKYDAHSVHW